MSRKSKAIEFLDQGYDIKVTGRNVLVTDAMKDYAMEKVSKIERFSERILDVNIIMDVQRFEHRVDILLWADNVKLKSTATTDNMYASIDKAVDKLMVQMSRHKQRMQNHHSPTHEEVAMNVNVYKPLTDDEILEFNDSIEEDNDRKIKEKFYPRQIVKQESRSLKTFTNNEALLKIDLSGDSFMVFRCEEDRKVKLIYKREDGHYGIIEVEK